MPSPAHTLRAAASAAPPPRPRRGGVQRWLLAPAVLSLLLWSLVPLAMTLYFSVNRYSLLSPDESGFAGLDNYRFLWSDPAFVPSIANTLLLTGAVLLISVVGGVLMAVLFDQPCFGRGPARLLAIAPFFVMPTVGALIWKNMLLHPVYGLFAAAAQALGLPPVDWLGQYPMFSLILIVSWQWLPFAFLILLTAIQSLDPEQKEAAQIDGAGPLAMFFHIVLPHLRRPIGVVVMIETIFLLSVFAEIYATTGGGPGTATTTLSFLIYAVGLQQFDVGLASTGGVLAVVLANIVAVFLIRMLAQNFKEERQT